MRTSGRLLLLLVAAWSAACQAPSAAPPPVVPAVDPPFRATSTIRELMQSMVAPSAQGLWDSVGRISDARCGKDSFLVGHGGKIVISYQLSVRCSEFDVRSAS